MLELNHSSTERIPCLECGDLFKPSRDWSKYCGSACKARYYQIKKINGLVEKYMMTVEEAAELKGCSESTIRKRIKLGRIRAEKVLGKLLVYRSQFKQKK